MRAAILVLLAERPMHGYEMIQQIAERSNGIWKPSPGSVYPTLQLLDDEGLITASETDGSKKLFELTDEGRAAAEKVETPPWEEIAEGADPGHVNLRAAMGQLFGAVAQSAHTATCRAAAAHRRHHQQCASRDLRHPRRGLSRRQRTLDEQAQDTSTQSRVRCTALRQPAYPAARWSSFHVGVQRLSSCQLARRSDGSAQNPTARPAA